MPAHEVTPSDQKHNIAQLIRLFRAMASRSFLTMVRFRQRIGT
jgi:hypothetical protein